MQAVGRVWERCAHAVMLRARTAARGRAGSLPGRPMALPLAKAIRCALHMTASKGAENQRFWLLCSAFAELT